VDHLAESQNVIVGKMDSQGLHELLIFVTEHVFEKMVVVEEIMSLVDGHPALAFPCMLLDFAERNARVRVQRMESVFDMRARYSDSVSELLLLAGSHVEDDSPAVARYTKARVQQGLPLGEMAKHGH